MKPVILPGNKTVDMVAEECLDAFLYSYVVPSEDFDRIKDSFAFLIAGLASDYKEFSEAINMPETEEE